MCDKGHLCRMVSSTQTSLHWALFKTDSQSNMFVERVFQGFDLKENDVVDFEEFVGVLSIFHPNAPLREKAACELS